MRFCSIDMPGSHSPDSFRKPLTLLGEGQGC
jgi:hypothetical protein